LFSAITSNDLDLIILLQTYYLTMVTTRSASKRMLEELAAASLILANEQAPARAQKQKPSSAKAERVRKQRSHAVTPHEDQPVSARLRSATRKKQEGESSIDTRQSVSEVKKQDVHQEAKHDPMEPITAITQPNVYAFPIPVVEEEVQTSVVTEAIVSREDPSKPTVTDFNGCRKPSKYVLQYEHVDDLWSFSTFFYVCGVSIVGALATQYLIVHELRDA
jgi:hypothetical protein